MPGCPCQIQERTDNLELSIPCGRMLLAASKMLLNVACGTIFSTSQVYLRKMDSHHSWVKFGVKLQNVRQMDTFISQRGALNFVSVYFDNVINAKAIKGHSFTSVV